MNPPRLPPINLPGSNQSVPFNLEGLRGILRHQEPMYAHTTWRVGGPAQWFYKPADQSDLMQLLAYILPDLPVFWLGLGSNLLVRDGGIPGLVILTAGCLNEIKLVATQQLYVQAGVSCAKVARFAAQVGLTGTEFLAGIPGTMGGALALNASAWGGETWSLVQCVETVDRLGQLHYRTATDYEIGYRQVTGPQNEWFISVTLQLQPHPIAENKAKIRRLLEQRHDNQPIGLPSSGSVFRNPPGYYAGQLIEQAGWKGQRVGGATVSEKHANFIINSHQATAADIENLITQITNSVEQHFGIRLVPEVHIIGIHC
ncbi:MAG: UDP-N-acetylmuramate dehydrogenase [Thioploca sp.]|nr:UDP-N-acetylmuramate dehydrogenase [Thioploca sp.]